MKVDLHTHAKDRSGCPASGIGIRDEPKILFSCREKTGEWEAACDRVAMGKSCVI